MRKENAALMMEGLIAGLVGYAAVVLFFAAVNVIAGRSIFYTAALLGTALFGDGANSGAVEVATGPVVTYNAVHLLVFLVLGLFAAVVVSKTERYPIAWVLTLLTVILVGASVVMALFLFAGPLFKDASWQLAAASALAAVLIGWYLVRRHPLLRRELGEIGASSV